MVPRQNPPADPRGRRLGARLESLAADLELAIGSAGVVRDPEVAATYTTDWTGRYGPKRAVVARPTNAEEIALCLDAAASHGVAVVPQGGNTGLVGGSVPNRHDTLVLSTRRCRQIGPIDEVTGQITVGAGVTLAELNSALRGSGWRFAVDFAARDSATIGGMVATNAGGIRVFRHGSTRQQVVGLEYVAADGRIARHLDAMAKDNTGYDLKSLLCGSEGTLAVISAVRLRLIPEVGESVVALCSFADLDEAIGFAWEIRQRVPGSEAIEYLDGACADLVAMTRRVALPVRGAAMILVEAAASVAPLDDLAAGIAAAGSRPDDVAFGIEPSQRRELWRLRDELTIALAALGTVHKYDVSVPHDRISHVRERTEAGLARLAPRSTAWWFGHVCDDNVHLNLTGPELGVAHGAERVDESTVAPRSLDELVFGFVVDAGGSISAEHGIGVHKVPYLHLARSATEIAHMRAIKAAFDPQSILNPGVILPG